MLTDPQPSNKLRPGLVTNDGPTGAVDEAYTLAASRARRAVEDLDTVLRMAGINDEQRREQAHAAFLLAFPISYRLWRSHPDNQLPKLPPPLASNP